MTTQTERQIVKTFKGKADLIVGIISLIIGILFIRGGVLLSVWSFGYNQSGPSFFIFGIFLMIVGIICMIHYGAKAPKVLYSDGTTGVLKKVRQ